MSGEEATQSNILTSGFRGRRISVGKGKKIVVDVLISAYIPSCRMSQWTWYSSTYILRVEVEVMSLFERLCRG